MNFVFTIIRANIIVMNLLIKLSYSLFFTYLIECANSFQKSVSIDVTCQHLSFLILLYGSVSSIINFT
jgi:hypothetical protein